MTTHAIDRRRVLAAATAGGALVLTGCGSAGSGLFGQAPYAPDADLAYSGATVVSGPDGTLYELAPEQDRVSQIGPDGRIAWEAEPGTVNWPAAVAFDSAGTVCVTNKAGGTLSSFGSDGTFLGEVGEPGSDPGQFHMPDGVAFDDRDHVYVCDSLNHRVQVFDAVGNPTLGIGGLGDGPGELNRPKSLAFDSGGDLHVLDTGNARIQVFEPGGAYLREYGGYGDGPGEFRQAQDFLIHEDDSVFVVDPALARIVVFERAGSGRVAHIGLVDRHGARLSPLRISLGPNGEIFLTVQSGATAAPGV